MNKEKKTYEIKQFGIETRNQIAYNSVYRNSYMNHNGGLGIIIKDKRYKIYRGWLNDKV